ncbi:hypothetical protein [Chenggangzhangella methanolivorans]|uniref:Rad50/SbcC-type AAA domain-containing protein n=1 Tax=Chenggangzhangella methanolivorans TaxID=1437009 RepID=A0A9E6RGQ8_9HYPH|nr:hypothetical protein [Chenggangzhangella methanolivorans]QZO01146.1 hypothetical protein K6K41_06230 [Chenggangzhangella methanolivorans]
MPQTVSFPIFQTLRVTDYALYRPNEADAFVWNFRDGPNALIGVNGLGKSTLVALIFRMLTGPWDLNRRALEGELGQPDVAPVMIADRRLFARRVSDQARSAKAELSLRLGSHKLVITRRLDDLALVSFCVDDKQLPIGNDDRDIYQPTIAELMSTGSFFDVLIVLRFLVFVFEDRRSLVWDESAQRQIFRATLSTTPAEAQRTLSLQRIIVEADSSARNTRVQVNKARHALDEAVRTLQSRDENQAALYVSEKQL